MSRAILFVLDSFGIGGAPDARLFGDEGANTFGHVSDHMQLELPHMGSLGLGLAAQASAGLNPLPMMPLLGRWGYATEISRGKDTITGHWEITGVPVTFDWGYFPHEIPAFPKDLLDSLIAQHELPGFLAMCHASGTEVIEDYGEEHLRTGKPIIYTSIDSVLQIAAHEELFGLQRLYNLCETARKLTYSMNIGRVIARPFIGSDKSNFIRTGHRKDYAIKAPQSTLLDRAEEAHRNVVSIGKIGDIFAHSGTGQEIKATGHAALMETTLDAMDNLSDGGLIMVNFVDFDTNFGHRRDPHGYGQALEEFDAMLPMVFSRMRGDDLLLLTADHGNDPTWSGTDHTREQVPIMTYKNNAHPGSIGHRQSFSDIGQTIAMHLGLLPLGAGEAWPL